MVSDPALGRSPADVVLHTPPGEHMDRPVVHANWEMDGQLALDVTEPAARVIGKADDICRCVKALLSGLESGDSSFDRHMEISIVQVAAAGANPPNDDLGCLVENGAVSRRRVVSIFVVAVVALATGFLVAGQVKVQLLTPSNQVARYQALVRSVQELEAGNADSRQKIAELRSQIDALEAAAAQRSAATQALRNKVAALRAHAGLTTLRGPGVEVDLANGVPGPDTSGGSGYQVNSKDVQDLVNLLFAKGAEGIAVNGRRITPLSAFSGSGGQVVIDQGPPVTAPIKVVAVGDRNRMEGAMTDPGVLPDIRAREVQFQLQVSFHGGPDLPLPAYDSSLDIRHVGAL